MDDEIDKVIVFDARMIGHSGIGTQVLNVLQGLSKNKNYNLKLLAEPKKIETLLSSFKGEVTTFDKPIYSIFEQIKFPHISKNEILHSPHYNASLRNIKNSVVVVHDLIHLQSEEFAGPQYRLYAWLLLSIISRFARHIITVSDTTRLELIKRFPKAAGKTTVIHNGIDHDLLKPATASQVSKFKKSYKLPAKFLLTVGIGKKHKNIDFLIRALSPLWKDGSIKEPLVIAGTKGKLPDYIKSEVNSLGVEKHIIILPFLDKEELPVMYSAASFFIYPSLLEGFGFPLVEAMACGCPVLSSSASCLPEIGADAALYFDPTNEEKFRKLLLATKKDKLKTQSMIKAGLKRSKKFSWKKHVSQLVDVYESLFET